MARRGLIVTLKALLAAVVAVAPAVLAHVFLRATGPVVAVSVWAAMLSVLLVLTPDLPERIRRTSRWLVRTLAVIGGFVLIADLVIIPLSAYLLWFDLVGSGAARGAVSFVFVMLVAYGSALYGAYVLRRPVSASAAYVCWMSFLSIPLFGRVESVLVLAGAAVLLLVAASASGKRVNDAARAARHSLTLLGIAVAIAVLSGGTGTPRGSRLVDQVLSPRLRDTVVTLFPAFPIMYDVPGYGYRIPSENIGVTPVLSNRALFRVSPVDYESIYLRTEVFHVFTGSSWQVSSTIQAAAPAEATLTTSVPGGPMYLRSADRPAGPAEPPGSPPSRRTEVVVLADYYSAIPHTLDTRAVSVSMRDRLSLDRPGESLGYLLREPLLYNDRITLYRETSDPAARPASSVYLEVPEPMAEAITALAEQLRGATPAESVVNVLRYLRDEFEYTLEPPQPRDRSRVVETFLEEHRRGYCVHFATAFTMLSRLQGIPTRYVTGFLVQPPPFDEYMPMFDEVEQYLPQDALVSGYSAHAWAEVWLPETGWRIVEATPPMQPYGYENSFFDEYDQIRIEGRTALQLQEILRRDVTERRTEPGPGFTLPRLPLWAGIVAVAALAVFLWLRFARPTNDSGRFHAAVRRMRSRSVRAGYPRPEDVGWTRWATAAGRSGDRVASVVIRVFFGGHSPAARDIRFVRLWTRRRFSARSGLRRSGRTHPARGAA